MSAGGPGTIGRDPVGDALERSAALVAVGRPTEAESVVRRALLEVPDDPHLLAELARVLVVDGRAAEAVGVAELAVAGAPQDAHVHVVLALVLMDLPRRAPDAVRAARRARELDPGSPGAHRTLARALLCAGRHDDAQAAADRAVAMDPEHADGHVLRGTTLLRRSRPVEAEAAYREALRLDPADAGALNDLGVALGAQGTDRGPEARAAFEAAARAEPGDPLARQNLASDARSWVNGRWAWGFVVFGTLQAVVRLTGDATDRAAGAVWALGTLGLVLYLLARGRRRRATLSPATQRLLAEQGWRERTQALSYRPWFWFVPAPVWVGISALLVVVWGTDLLGGGTGDRTATGVGFGVALVVLLLTGRRTWQLWGAPWWAGRRER